MSFMNKQIIDQVVTPLLGMKKTILVGITTPSSDEFNFFTRMLNLKYEGTDKNVFGTLIVDLACAECKKYGRAADCKHMQYLLPKWKGSDKFELTKLLYGATCSDTHQRESMGIVVTADDKLFKLRWLQRLEKRPFWCRTDKALRPSHIFIGIDPNSSGSSQMAIITIAYIQGAYVIMGIDSHPTNNAEEVQMFLTSHVEGLRAMPMMATAHIIVISERCTGFESWNHWDIIKRYPPSTPVYQKYLTAEEAMDTPFKDPGIWTDDVIKAKYARAISEKLQGRLVFFHYQCIVGNPYTPAVGNLERIESMKMALISQLANCRVKRPNMDPNQLASMGSRSVRLTWSGKIGSNGKEIPGQNDDLAVTFGLTLYWVDRIREGNYPGFPYDVVFPGNSLARYNANNA